MFDYAREWKDKHYSAKLKAFNEVVITIIAGLAVMFSWFDWETDACTFGRSMQTHLNSIQIYAELEKYTITSHCGHLETGIIVWRVEKSNIYTMQ